MSNIGAEKSRAGAQVIIYQMTEHDLLEVVEIEERTGLSRWGWDAYYGELARPGETVMLVARLAEGAASEGFRVIGFIAARLVADELHINNMAVREGHRKRGIGSLLLGQALEEGKRLGARRSFLEVRLSNNAAQALYKSFGFRPGARRAGYYTDPVEDALVMNATLA